jgi:hypothetical protein
LPTTSDRIRMLSASLSSLTSLASTGEEAKKVTRVKIMDRNNILSLSLYLSAKKVRAILHQKYP